MNDQTPPKTLNLLKELLFETESRRLEDLSRRLEQEVGAAVQREKTLSERIDVVYDRAGTEERLLHSVAAIIDGALREAEVTRHEQVSRAIAPLVVRTIKLQLRESQDEMVDALYPITGRMVKTYVQAEINRLMVEINAKLGGASPAGAAQGNSNLSPADLALAAANTLQVQEMFLVRRGSGDLIAHWERPEPSGAVNSVAQGSNRDVLLSGYLSGIMSLSEEAFGAAPGSFRTLSFSGGDRIFVRGAAAHLLAVRCSGSAPASVEQVIDEVFLDALERYQHLLGGAETGQDTASQLASLLPSLARDIEERTHERREALTPAASSASIAKPSFGRLYALAAAIAAPFVIWAGWAAYQSFETMRVESTANRVLETVDEVAGLPPKIEVDRGGRALTISGFVPTAELRDRIVSRLGQELPQSNIRNRLGVLPKDSREFEVALARWRAQSEQQIQELGANAIRRAVSRTHERVGAIRDIGVNLTERIGTPAQAQQLRRSLNLAFDQSASPSSGAAAEHGRLVALWETLGEAERTLAGIASGRAQAAQRSGTPPADDGLLADACAAAADRIGASLMTLLAARIDSLQPTARDEAEKFIRKSVVFFANNTDFRDAAAASAMLDQIARRLRDNPTLNLRIVGYTDERGTQSLNLNLAQQRADVVASQLTERGIAANRVMAVGRSVGKELARNAGPTSPNRRVEFEIRFPGELDAAP